MILDHLHNFLRRERGNHKQDKTRCITNIIAVILLYKQNNSHHSQNVIKNKRVYRCYHQRINISDELKENTLEEGCQL
jgi:hypothetical protein